MQNLVAKDYPDWTTTSYSRASGTDPRDTIHTVGLEHKNRPIQLSVEYTSWPNGYSFTTEQVLRNDSAFSDGSDALLDLLEELCAKPGIRIGVVSTSPEQQEVVSWYKTTGWWIFTNTIESSDYFEYDPDANSWSILRPMSPLLSCAALTGPHG